MPPHCEEDSRRTPTPTQSPIDAASCNQFPSSSSSVHQFAALADLPLDVIENICHFCLVIPHRTSLIDLVQCFGNLRQVSRSFKDAAHSVIRRFNGKWDASTLSVSTLQEGMGLHGMPPYVFTSVMRLCIVTRCMTSVTTLVIPQAANRPQQFFAFVTAEYLENVRRICVKVPTDEFIAQELAHDLIAWLRRFTTPDVRLELIDPSKELLAAIMQEFPERLEVIRFGRADVIERALSRLYASAAQQQAETGERTAPCRTSSPFAELSESATWAATAEGIMACPNLRVIASPHPAMLEAAKTVSAKPVALREVDVAYDGLGPDPIGGSISAAAFLNMVPTLTSLICGVGIPIETLCSFKSMTSLSIGPEFRLTVPFAGLQELAKAGIPLQHVHLTNVFDVSVVEMCTRFPTLVSLKLQTKPRSAATSRPCMISAPILHGFASRCPKLHTLGLEGDGVCIDPTGWTTFQEVLLPRLETFSCNSHADVPVEVMHDMLFGRPGIHTGLRGLRGVPYASVLRALQWSASATDASSLKPVSFLSVLHTGEAVMRTDRCPEITMSEAHAFAMLHNLSELVIRDRLMPEVCAAKLLSILNKKTIRRLFVSDADARDNLSSHFRAVALNDVFVGSRF